MNKDQLAQELQQKLKRGIKPSDLKKSKNINGEKALWTPLSPLISPSHQKNNTPASSPPASPLITPLDKKSQQKQEPKNTLTSPSKLKQLQEQINFHANIANTYLTNLQATMARLDQAELTIQELQEKNEKLNKTLTSQEKPSKVTGESPSTFTCSSCTRTFNIELIRLAKKSGKKICRNCTLLMLKRANQLTGQRIVLKVKSEQVKSQPTFTCQACQQTNEGEPHLVHLTNFQEQGISPRQLTSVCSPCLQDKVILADFYCPRTSEGRDTWDPKEPQFDCDCPTRPGGGKL